MSTLSSSPRPVKAKKERFVRLLTFLPTCGEFVVEIEECGKHDSVINDYYVHEFPVDFGRGFRWEKFCSGGKDVYHVNVGDDTHPASCECKGHLHHGHRTVCKHIAATRALIAEGKF
jgi:hypothetical protein